MKRPNEIEREEIAMGALVELTSVFEGIASMKIAQIKNQVLEATAFFNQLWHIYSQLHVSAILDSDEAKMMSKLSIRNYTLLSPQKVALVEISTKS